MFGPAWPSGHSAQLSLGSGDVPATSRRRQLGLAYPHVAVASMQSLAYPHGAIARWQDWAGLHVAILPVAETIYFAVQALALIQCDFISLFTLALKGNFFLSIRIFRFQECPDKSDLTWPFRNDQ